MNTISFYIVNTDSGKTFLVNTDSEEKAKKLVQIEYPLDDIMSSWECDILPNECRNLENMFL